MSVSTETYNQDLHNLFRYYARLFTINEIFMSHGLTLLSRYVNLRESTYQRIVFREPLHVVHMSNCRNIVYLKLWHDEQEAAEGNSLTTLQVPPGTKLYVGQTENPRTRESSLQPYLLELGAPNSHICIGHGLSTYHRDALETATIAWCMFLHGLALLNRSPFSNHYYRNVNTEISIDGITEEHYTSVGAFHNWRLTIVIGTAPSRTVFESFLYQNHHVTEQVPFVDWDEFLSQGGLARFRVLIGQLDPPPFADHWPDEECDLIDDWLRGKRVTDIEEADRTLKSKMATSRRFLGVMLGARPTRLTPGQQVERYLSSTCGRLTFSNLVADYKVAFLWLPHPAVSRYIQRKDQYVLEQLFICSSQAIAGIELKLFSIGVTASSEGITSSQAEELQDWWVIHPVSKVLRCLSDNLASIMASYHVDVNIPTVSTTIFDANNVTTETERLLYLIRPSPNKLHELWYSLTIVNLPNYTENPSTIFNTQLQSQEEGRGANVEGTIMFTLNKRFDSYIRKKALHSSQEFYLLTTGEQANILRMQVSEYGLEMRRRFTKKQIRLGRFVRSPGETEIEEMDRCRREFFHQRSRIPTSPGQALYTCLRCNYHLPRRTETSDYQIKVEHGCSCGRTSFNIGWHALQITADPGTYPANNLFVRHIQSMPEPLVINHKQLQASLILFLQESDQEDDPQGVMLVQRYEELFESCLAFKPQPDGKSRAYSHFSSTFNSTYRKLQQEATSIDTEITLDFRIVTRPPLQIERDALASSATRNMYVFAFGFPQELEVSDAALLSLEDVNYLGYSDHLEKVARERRAKRRR